jgi:pyruvate formate lyase activating enzyme
MQTDQMVKGMVLKIDRFSTHDGPGIRTVVFFKGCPLRCLWCSTPESQNTSRELIFSSAKCIHCGKCVQVCPTCAITIGVNEIPLTNRILCNDCGKCVDVCIGGARTLAGKEMTVKEVISEIEKDSLFYWNSGGGVTLSGGDPTMQPEFAGQILKGCHEVGIHTAMETSGYIKWKILNEILKCLDFIYVDIKHASTGEHLNLTGRENNIIIDNLKSIVTYYPKLPLILRLPVIPGLNDSIENVQNVIKIIQLLPGSHKIELLPYHKLGVHKYGSLLREYKLSHLEPPAMDKLIKIKNLFEESGIRAQIGG